MSSINKTSVLSQFSSALAALNVSTAGTESLVMYLKSALNAEVSANTIISELTSRVNDVTGSDELKEIVLLAVATSLITEDRVITVPDLTTLSGMTNAIAGTVFFVESEGFPYVRKSNGDWVLIDASLQKPALENAYAWGYNSSGQLGDSTTVSKSSPVSVVGGFTDWTQLNISSSHSVGIRANRTAWAWGAGAAGRLGDNTTVNKSSPVSVVGGFTDWTQLSSKTAHTLGVRSNGSAWAWGLNSNGQLGDGTVTDRSSPVSVIGGGASWTQVSASGRHSLGVRVDGTAWAWGNNLFGRLGDNTTVNKSSPVSVVGGFTDWVQLSAGYGINPLVGFQFGHSLGLRANGTAWAWGNNSKGQLGDDTTVGKSSPVSIVGGFTDWTQLSAGETHGIGLRANGTAWAWGYNSYGQLGDNTTVSKSSPVSVIGGFTDWVEVSAGTGHVVGLRANGTTWSWGYNDTGQLGDGTVISKRSPVSVIGGFTDWVQVSCSTKSSGGIRGS